MQRRTQLSMARSRSDINNSGEIKIISPLFFYDNKNGAEWAPLFFYWWDGRLDTHAMASATAMLRSTVLCLTRAFSLENSSPLWVLT